MKQYSIKVAPSAGSPKPIGNQRADTSRSFLHRLSPASVCFGLIAQIGRYRVETGDGAAMIVGSGHRRREGRILAGDVGG